MTYTIEIRDERLEGHLEAGEPHEEFIEELLDVYEETRFVTEGYSG